MLTITIGLISDTHGLLRPEALAGLRGSDVLIHAGDIGKPEILDELSRLAPLTVVRGNNDTAAWAADLPETATLWIGAVAIHVLHDLALLAPDAAAGCRVVVAGHSHRPAIAEENGVLYVNPGSAGPRRFTLPIAIGRLRVAGDQVAAEICELAVAR
jgi:putative phosphoesterase